MKRRRTISERVWASAAKRYQMDVERIVYCKAWMAGRRARRKAKTKTLFDRAVDYAWVTHHFDPCPSIAVRGWLDGHKSRRTR